jgi:tRNA threonylcarbamoyladenosine biosynthesis protein TsaE
MSLTLTSNSPAETRRIGERLARLLQPGDVVLLQGELGAGKTCLAQGIGRGLHVAEAVKSSSFVLVNEYSGRLHVHHADLFRLNEPEEVAELGLEENAGEGLLLIEWPDRAPGEMPDEHLRIRFDVIDYKSRRITLEPKGARYEELVRQMASAQEPRRARRGA